MYVDHEPVCTSLRAINCANSIGQPILMSVCVLVFFFWLDRADLQATFYHSEKNSGRPHHMNELTAQKHKAVEIIVNLL